ncbi:MAG: hypothetical protein ACRD16_06735 [Thermoanaerobaculia bacterium]
MAEPGDGARFDLSRSGEALRSLPETRNAHLVAVSGWDRAENLRKSIEAGIEHFVTKPADPAVLERLLAGLARA